MVVKSTTLVLLFQLASMLDANSNVLPYIPVAFQGYDITWYWNHSINDTNNVPLKGSPLYAINFTSNDENGIERVYELRFGSENNLSKFKSNPYLWLPKLGGFCGYGISSTYPPSGPWDSDHLGPPAGNDQNNLGWIVYDGDLFFNLNTYYQNIFLSSDNNIAIAYERWISWFGSLEAGPLNFYCFTDNSTAQDICTNEGQPYAPEKTSFQYI